MSFFLNRVILFTHSPSHIIHLQCLAHLKQWTIRENTVCDQLHIRLFKCKAKGFIPHVSCVSLSALVLKRRMKEQRKQNVSAGTKTLVSTSSSSSSSFSVSDIQLFHKCIWPPLTCLFKACIRLCVRTLQVAFRWTINLFINIMLCNIGKYRHTHAVNSTFYSTSLHCQTVFVLCRLA